MIVPIVVDVPMLGFFIGSIAQTDDGGLEMQLFASQRVIKVQSNIIVTQRVDPGAHRAAALWHFYL